MARAENVLPDPVSIHAPARGATIVALSNAISYRLFQSTRPRGARPMARAENVLPDPVSIHAPARGATIVALSNAISYRLFQSTRPRGARRVKLDLGLCRAPVSIHAPARGATNGILSRQVGDCGFNPRARAGRDTRRFGTAFPEGSFNPRARAGRDPRLSCAIAAGAGFNPRARAGRDSQAVRSPYYLSCFNPRARAGRDVDTRRVALNGELVSIHAPARGATASAFMIFSRVTSFNPRARAGRDRRRRGQRGCRQEFQSTRPRGARRLHEGEKSSTRIVSIHAPARGATGRYCVRPLHDSSFNPRARAGRDWVFPPSWFSHKSFNPRARAGRDLRPDPLADARRVVSIHAPARGATTGRHCIRPFHDPVSIHAPARGATFFVCTVVADMGVSIHAPARGATVTGKRPIIPAHVSIHAPARGATPPCFLIATPQGAFQSTRPRGARR